jgi:hypothetical protein
LLAFYEKLTGRKPCQKQIAEAQAILDVSRDETIH